MERGRRGRPRLDLRDWDEVARFYWGLVREQLRPTEEVRRTAAESPDEALARGAAPPGERRAAAAAAPARAAAGGVDPATKRLLVSARSTASSSPRRATSASSSGSTGTSRTGWTTCSRRASATARTRRASCTRSLEALGIDSRLVLLRMRRLGRIAEAPASLAVFNHAILVGAGLDLWLDGTASWSGSRELPGEDRGATALVVNPEGPPRFVTVPEARPEENRTESRFEVARAGRARHRARHLADRGRQAPEYRRAYLSEHERRAQLEKAFNRTFPGLRVQAVTSPTSRGSRRTCGWSSRSRCRATRSPTPAACASRRSAAPAGYVESYASLSSAATPSSSASRWRRGSSTGTRCRRGGRDRVPEDVAGEVPEAAFEVATAVEDDARRPGARDVPGRARRAGALPRVPRARRPDRPRVRAAASGSRPRPRRRRPR